MEDRKGPPGAPPGTEWVGIQIVADPDEAGQQLAQTLLDTLPPAHSLALMRWLVMLGSSRDPDDWQRVKAPLQNLGLCLASSPEPAADRLMIAGYLLYEVQRATEGSEGVLAVLQERYPEGPPADMQDNPARHEQIMTDARAEYERRRAASGKPQVCDCPACQARRERERAEEASAGEARQGGGMPGFFVGGQPWQA